MDGLIARWWWKWSDAGLPLMFWRPYCWLSRHHERHYKHCVFCGKYLDYA